MQNNPAYTMAAYQHVLPGMQAEAATTFEQLIQEPESHKCDESPGRDGRNPEEERF